MERNIVTLVDTQDNILGYGEKIKAHKAPLLHRAFSIFLVDNNKMLIHKRNTNKYHCGGLWTNACCSHPTGDILISAKQRLNEELGISCDIKEIFNFIYYAQFPNGLFEYELDHVFIGNFNQNNIINYNKNEIEELLWIEIEELEKLLFENPQIFTPWFLHACPRVIEYCKQNKVF